MGALEGAQGTSAAYGSLAKTRGGFHVDASFRIAAVKSARKFANSTGDFAFDFTVPMGPIRPIRPKQANRGAPSSSYHRFLLFIRAGFF